MWKPGSDKPTKAAAPKAAAPAPAPAPTAAASTAGNEARPTSKSALSQKTLAMKYGGEAKLTSVFMQRKKQAEVRKQTAAQERKKQDAWVVDESPEDDRDGSSSAIVCVQDVPDPSLPLLFGRRSFGGFNKGVEDEYREVSRQQRFAASEEKELRDEVSAEEMTDRMIKYTGLMRGGGGNKQGNKQGGNRAPKRQRK